MSRFSEKTGCAVSLLLAALLSGACSDGSLVIYPGMSLDEVDERSSGFDDELMHADRPADSVNELANNEYANISLVRGADVQLEIAEPVFMRIFVENGIVGEVDVRAVKTEDVEMLCASGREIVESLKALGWNEVDAFRPVASRMTPEVFEARPGDTDRLYRHAGSLVDPDGVIAAFDLIRYRENAWLDIRFELPRDETGNFMRNYGD